MKILLMSSLRKSKYANHRDTHEMISLGKIFRVHFYSRKENPDASIQTSFLFFGL